MTVEAPNAATEGEKPPQKQACKKMTWSMHACIWYSLVASVLILGCLAGGGVSPRWEGPVADDNYHAAIAILLIFSLAVTELCIVIGGASQGELLTTVGFKASKGNPLTLPGAHDAWLTLLEYGCKLITGAYLHFCSGGVIHMDALAVNGARPVYLARFAQWSVAVPLVVLITNAAFEDFGASLMRRSWPMLWASWTYVWAGWLAEVTPHHEIRWLMVMLTLTGATCAALDQLLFAREHRSDRLFNAKFGLLLYTMIVDGTYAVMFLMGRFGLISSGHEQIYYAYADASMKVLHGALLAMIRNREGTSEINRWFVAAMSAGDNLKNLVSQATIPILTVDLKGNVVEWNDSLGQLTGICEADVRGKNIVDLSTNDCKEDLRQNLDRKINAFKSESASMEADSSLLELSLMADTSRDKSLPTVRTLAMSIAAKRNSAGVLEGITAIGQDLSEISDLKMVQERKDALLAMLGHEIRSPLHGVMGLTSALLENPANKHLSRQLGMVKGCTARLLDLVNNIMDLAQSEKKKREGLEQSKPTAIVDLSNIVDEAIVMIGNSVDKANKPLLKPGIRLVNTAVGTEIPLVRGDAYKCTQLLYNLLTNAAKFTDRGSIKVSFRHLPQENRLEVDVADTGKGISEAGQKRIFHPFEQEMNGDCRQFQGIGLGLAVCKEIIELHQGLLKVKSVVGQGSTFTLSFPCDGNLGYVKVHGESICKEDTLGAASAECTSVGCKAARSPELVQPQTSTPTFKTKPLVLSVDDDEVNQEVIQNALGDMCDVKCTMSGMETLEYFERLVKSETPFPALVLLDIQMPGMSGFEVCERIRATYEKSLSKLPVTMLSAKVPADSAALQSFESGCTDFIPKPFHMHLLRKKVITALTIRESNKDTNGVSGITVLTSEAQKIIKEHEDEAKKALERTLALERELNEVKRQASAADDRANALEQENSSLLSANEFQKAEISRTLKERDDAQKQARMSSPVSPSPQAKPTVKEKAQLEGFDDSMDGSFRYEGIQDALYSRDATNMRVAVNLLASRLKMCSRSAKQCKQLLSSSRLSLVAPAGFQDQQREYQLKMTRLVKVTEMELTILEHMAANTGSIMHFIQHDEATNYDTSDGQWSVSTRRSLSS
eukprot:TRINITY_DN3870_c0_g1_i2.p1 TRINITY_DN3870_c0_g1~~TRINITY_DN3870_c0_g1_i2.p1  ORF type:complete len:1122 (-),score=173.44 TRINITY_DN3870_c0_g1_i2:140-3505(-)